GRRANRFRRPTSCFSVRLVGFSLGPMGGDDSQKLLPWRGIHSSPGRKPPPRYETNTLPQRPFVPKHSSVAALQRLWGGRGMQSWKIAFSITEQFWNEQPLERHAQTGPRGEIPQNGRRSRCWRRKSPVEGPGHSCSPAMSRSESNWSAWKTWAQLAS